MARPQGEIQANIQGKIEGKLNGQHFHFRMVKYSVVCFHLTEYKNTLSNIILFYDVQGKLKSSQMPPNGKVEKGSNICISKAQNGKSSVRLVPRFTTFSFCSED